MSQQRRSTEIAHRQAVERVIAAMRDDPQKPWSLETLGDVALMSPYHFNRVFRRVTGVPPRRFLASLRTEAAKRLLATTDYSILRICLEVGYSSPGTFSNRFQRAVGLSPRDFRSLIAGGTGADREALCVLPNAGGPRHARTSDAPGLRGRLLPFDTTRGPIFVGLFPHAIPEGPPVACAVLDCAGEFLIPRAPEGRYHLFATAVDRAREARPSSWNESAWVAGLKDNRRVTIRKGRRIELVTLELGPPPSTAPPVVMSVRAYLLRASKQPVDRERPTPSIS